MGKDLVEEKGNVIVREVLKRSHVLLHDTTSRNPRQCDARTAAWAEVQRAVIRACGVKLNKDQMNGVFNARKKKVRDVFAMEKRYRTATGGGIDREVERVISANRGSWNEEDNQLARYFGNRTAFKGIPGGESFKIPCSDIKFPNKKESPMVSGRKYQHEKVDRRTSAVQVLDEHGHEIGEYVTYVPKVSYPGYEEEIDAAGFLDVDPNNENDLAESGDIMEQKGANGDDGALVEEDWHPSAQLESSTQMEMVEDWRAESSQSRKRRQKQALAIASDSEHEEEGSKSSQKRRSVSNEELLRSQSEMFALMKVFFEKSVVTLTKLTDRLENLGEKRSEEPEQQLERNDDVPLAGDKHLAESHYSG